MDGRDEVYVIVRNALEISSVWNVDGKLDTSTTCAKSASFIWISSTDH